MEKYKGVILAAVTLLEEYAKTTETTLDDAGVQLARVVLGRFLSGEVTEMALVDEKAALLPVLLGSPALFQFLMTLLRLLRKE